MTDYCIFCDLEIRDIDRYHGRVVELQNGEAHTWCRVINSGVVPECPLALSVKPPPCTNLCVQAQFAEPEEDCSSICENLLCQIGKSVRALRAFGKIDWDGYIPKEIRNEVFQEYVKKEKDKYDLSSYNDAKQRVDWPRVYDFLQGLSSHTVYKPSYIAERLESCGFIVNVFPSQLGLGVIGYSLETVEPDYGTPGIWSLDLAYLLYEICTGERFVSDYSGRGWQYRDILEHFKKREIAGVAP